MESKEPAHQGELVFADLTEFLQQAARERWPWTRADLPGPTSYRLAFGKEPIELGMVEFQILLYLASRPYRAFSQRAIAEAVHHPEGQLTEEQVDDYVDTLRDQLGILHDYVQTVPHIGYRFKA